MTSVSKLAIAMTLAGAIAGLAGPAVAGCKRMGFLVNDYGKDGPTKDAKSLLDKHIAQWAAEQGIEKYTVGKKDVKCDLFLNLIVVDEHTCTASATVCWGNDKMPASQQDASTGDAPKSEPKPKAKKQAAAKAAEEKAAETKPAEVKTEAPKAAAVETSAPTKVETGALPHENKPADAPASVDATPQTQGVAADAAEAAAAAAERAAAAAERAAQAAERAAAALAASGAAPATPGAAPAPAMPGAADTAAAAGSSSSSVSVPPLAAEGASKP